MFIAFLCATAAVAGAANIAIVDDVLEFDTPIGGAVVKGALHVGGDSRNRKSKSYCYPRKMHRGQRK